LLYRRNCARLRRFRKLNNKIRFGIASQRYSRSITLESAGAARFSGDAQDVRDTRNTLKQSIRSKTIKSTTAITIDNADTILQWIPEYRVIVCRDHKYAISSVT
jgi:hypothetical protein